LIGLLILALHLNKIIEADEIMGRIANRIHMGQQAVCLAWVGKAWERYFLSGWLRERLGVDVNELKEYARFVCETTRKRLENGVLKATEVFKDHSMKEMLDELDRNTVETVVPTGYFEYANVLYEDNDGEGKEHVKTAPYSHPSTILRKPATTEHIVEAETAIGRILPDDLKEFYALTNGTRPVIQGLWQPPIPKLPLMSVQSLFWQEEDWMTNYAFDLLPEGKLRPSINWPGIEYGGIAMYESVDQGEYLWYLTEELVGKAKKVLDDAYQKKGQTEKQALDALVKMHHGSWERLKNLKTCWYKVRAEVPEAKDVYPDFKAFLGEVVLKSRVEEDKSPLKAPKEGY
jgi:SMI1/KNR4 family protein SUKH-1